MRRIGFSTGAVARGNYRVALAKLREHGVHCVELSALRIEELRPLVEDLASLDLGMYEFASLHAPSSFPADRETEVLSLLDRVALAGLPIVAHPDVIFNVREWHRFGDLLLVENMDKRKTMGRTLEEMERIFEHLPAARFCFDIGHARQVDPSMTEAWMMASKLSHRLGEVHMSEVNTASRHDPLSRNAIIAFRRLSHLLPAHIPIILEPLIDAGQSDIQSELSLAKEVFQALAA